MPSSGSDSDRVPLRTWGLLALVVVIAALVRLRLLNVPLERDEGEYAYAGQLILSGVPPYTLLYNMKLPGTYLIYALSMLLFGQTIAGARLGLLLATSATCLGVFQLARRFVPAKDSLAAAASYAVFALSTEMLGPFGHATHYVALFGVWGLVFLATALERERIVKSFASGIFLGLAVLMKQPGAVFLACAAIWIAAGPSATKTRHLVALALGTVVPFAMLTAWLLFSGSFARFWLWVVQYGREYGGLVGLAEGWENLRLHMSWIFPQAPMLWLLALSGIGLLLTRGFPSRARLRASSLLALSFVGVCPGLYFREHYFLLLVPALSLLVALASNALRSVPIAGPWLAPALIAFGCGQALYVQREILLYAPPDEVSKKVYGPNLFVESVQIGRYLRDRTRPDDWIFILGSEPQIPFYAQRKSATGIVYMYPLLERHPLAHAMGETLIHEVEKRRPAYAVLVGNPESWREAPEPRPRFLDWAPRYLGENYVITGQILASERGIRYLWEAAAARWPIGEATKAIVMRRADIVPAP
jgi:hypothetical protein